jgi:hypothetical protein
MVDKGTLLRVSHDISAGLFSPAQRDLKVVMDGLRRSDPSMTVAYSQLSVPGASSAARADAVVKSREGNLYFVTLTCTTGVERWTVEVVAPSKQLAEVIADGQVKALRIDSQGEVRDSVAKVKQNPVAPPKPAIDAPVPTTVQQGPWTVTFPAEPILTADRGPLERVYKVSSTGQPLTYWLDCSTDSRLTGTSLEDNFEWRKNGYQAINTAVERVRRGTCNGLPFIEFETGGTQTRRHRIFWIEPNIAVVLLAERPNGSPWPQVAQSYFDSFKRK